MGVNVKLFWVLSAFYFVSSALYVVWSLVDPFHEQVEWAGSLALACCGMLFALIAFYLGRAHKAQGARGGAGRGTDRGPSGFHSR